MFENLPDDEAAIQADQRLSELETAYRRNFVERGYVLLAVETRRLWTRIIDPSTGHFFSSLERWILVRAPHSRSDCYASLGAVKELKDIPESDLVDIPRKNIPTLQKLSTAVRRDPEVLAAAKTKSEAEFLSHVQKHHPEQHLEGRQKLILNASQSQYDAITARLDLAMTYYGVTNYSDAIEAVLADWELRENPVGKIEQFSLETVN